MPGRKSSGGSHSPEVQELPSPHVALDLLHPGLGEQYREAAQTPDTMAERKIASMQHVAAAISQLHLKKRGQAEGTAAAATVTGSTPGTSASSATETLCPELKLEKYKQAVQEVSAALGGAEPEGQLVIEAVLGKVGVKLLSGAAFCGGCMPVSWGLKRDPPPAPSLVIPQPPNTAACEPPCRMCMRREAMGRCSAEHGAAW